MKSENLKMKIADENLHIFSISTPLKWKLQIENENFCIYACIFVDRSTGHQLCTFFEFLIFIVEAHVLRLIFYAENDGVISFVLLFIIFFMYSRPWMEKQDFMKLLTLFVLSMGYRFRWIKCYKKWGIMENLQICKFSEKSANFQIFVKMWKVFSGVENENIFSFHFHFSSANFE